MSLMQEMESISEQYVQRFHQGIPGRILRSMPIEEQMSKMREALKNGAPVDWGFETAEQDPNSLLPNKINF